MLDIISNTISDLRGVNLKGLDLRSAVLQDAVLKRAFYDLTTKWPEDFDYQQCGAIGPKADLSGLDLSGLDLSDLNLEDAVLINCNFSNANLQGVNFSGADLTAANFSSSDIRGANLVGCILKQARFQDAISDFRTQLPKLSVLGLNPIDSHASLRMLKSIFFVNELFLVCFIFFLVGVWSFEKNSSVWQP